MKEKRKSQKIDIKEPVSKELMESNDEIIFFLGEVASVHIWAQVVHPP